MGDTPDTNRPPKREVIDDEFESTTNQPAAKIVKREEEPDPSYEVLELRQKVIELEQKLVKSQQNELMWKGKYERAVRSNAADGARMRHLENLDKKPVIAVKTEKDEEEAALYDPPSHILIPPLQQAAAALNSPVLASPNVHTEKKKKKKKGKQRNVKTYPVFVHNLSRNTSSEALKNLFSQRFAVINAKVAHECNIADLRSESPFTPMARAIVRFLSKTTNEPNPADPTTSISFGVVDLYSRHVARNAVKAFQGLQLDGQSIELTKDYRKELFTAAESARKHPLQLIVKNVPLQASPSEVESIFSACIGFKSLYMPKNVDGSHHGFGFIDFELMGDAWRARSKLPFPTLLHGEKLELEIMSYSKKEENERILVADSHKKPVIAVEAEVEEEETELLHDPFSLLLIPPPQMHPSQYQPLPLPISRPGSGSNAVALSRVAVEHAPPSQQVQQQAAAASNSPVLACPDPTEEKGKSKEKRRGTVFVHNLSTKTSSKALEKFFSQRFDVLDTKVAHECSLADLHSGSSPNWISEAFIHFLAANESNPISMGIVQFYTKHLAAKAIRTFQGMQLDGRSIELTNSAKVVKNETVYEDHQLIVKNVPLQATPSEVESLFSSCIGFKSLRMPKNANGSHHGFGFIDFELRGDTGRVHYKRPFPIHLHGEILTLEHVAIADIAKREKFLLEVSLMREERAVESKRTAREEPRHDDDVPTSPKSHSLSVPRKKPRLL